MEIFILFGIGTINASGNILFIKSIQSWLRASLNSPCSGSFVTPDQRSTMKQFSIQDGTTVKPDTSAWRGTHDVMTVGESDGFDIGSGQLYWSVAGGQEGYFYAGDYTNPKVEIANVLGYRKNECRGLFDFGFR